MSAWWRVLDSARADEELCEELCEEFVDHRPYEIVVTLEIKVSNAYLNVARKHPVRITRYELPALFVTLEIFTLHPSGQLQTCPMKPDICQMGGYSIKDRIKTLSLCK
jgi:hypothetical protein